LERKAMMWWFLACPLSWHSSLVTPKADHPAGDGRRWKRRSSGGSKRPWGGQINLAFLPQESR